MHYRVQRTVIAVQRPLGLLFALWLVLAPLCWWETTAAQAAELSSIAARKPQLVNPRTLYLNNDRGEIDYWGNGGDLLVIVEEKITVPVKIGNVRHVVMIGGEFTINKPLSASLPRTEEERRKHRALGFGNINGTVYLEGIWINNSGGGLAEGIQFFSNNGQLVLRNSRIEGVRSKAGDTNFAWTHPDLLMVLAGRAALENVTFRDSPFQGIFFQNSTGNTIKELVFRNVNTAKITRQAWFFDDLGGTNPVVKGCENCWHDPRDAKFAGDMEYSLMPKPQIINGDAVWNNEPKIARGTTIRCGVPPRGDFAPRDRVGFSYDPLFFDNSANSAVPASDATTAQVGSPVSPLPPLTELLYIPLLANSVRSSSGGGGGDAGFSC